MIKPLSEALGVLTPESLQFGRGIERESLRVDQNGSLSKQPHPAAFGSKLTHPTITTDFSESQLELITPVSSSIKDALGALEETMRYAQHQLSDEVLWSASMPCVLNGDKDIPLAYYGESNLGRLKTTYRRGLGNRYGRSMQTICAVHYNFSLKDAFWRTLSNLEGAQDNWQYRTGRYFDMMRNFRRLSWLALYVTGASPAVCNSFVKGREHQLQKFDEGSLYLPGATSLRSGNLGYQSNAQSELINICYNDLDTYVTDIARAATTPYEPYTQIPTVVDGEYSQVSANILQTEAEFYTTIRAKRVPDPGENFLKSLIEKGVEYVEVRLIDVNPYDPLGISEETIKFIDTLLLYCLLTDSPHHGDDLCGAVSQNVSQIVNQGRDSNTRVLDGSKPRYLKEWATSLLNEMKPIAALLDTTKETGHIESIDRQLEIVADPTQTFSGRMISDMQSQSVPFFRLAMNQALAHKEHFLSTDLDAATLEKFEELRRISISQQEDIEAKPRADFAEYLEGLQKDYLSVLST